MNKYIWPNFFIVGAPRAGTTSLYNYLKNIPQVYMSPVKEPGYFIPNDFRGFSEETYLELFKEVKDEKAIGEASAGYLASIEAANQIKENIPTAKIIIILRNPVKRTFSHYLNHMRAGNSKIPFEEALKKFQNHDENNLQLEEAIHVSMYYKQVKGYLKIFGKKNIKILIFEEIIKDPENEVKKILKFLDVDSKPQDNIKEKYNAYSEPLGKIGTNIVKNKIINKIAKKIIPFEKGEWVLRTVLNKKGEKPVLSHYAEKKLENIFQEDVKKLENLLDRTLPWNSKEREK